MKNSRGAITRQAIMLALVSSLLFLSAPVRADDPASPAAGRADSSTSTVDDGARLANNTKATSPAPAGKSWQQDLGDQTSADLSHAGSFILKAPRRAPGFSAGVLFGTPIAILRQCTGQVLNATRGQWETNKNPILLVSGLCLGVPGGILGGFLDGVWVGPANAWVNADKPFSKESFSLGEMIYDPTDL